jgi:hypothetical protein
VIHGSGDYIAQFCADFPCENRTRCSTCLCNFCSNLFQAGEGIVRKMDTGSGLSMYSQDRLVISVRIAVPTGDGVDGGRNLGIRPFGQVHRHRIRARAA